MLEWGAAPPTQVQGTQLAQPPLEGGTGWGRRDPSFKMRGRCLAP